MTVIVGLMVLALVLMFTSIILMTLSDILQKKMIYSSEFYSKAAALFFKLEMILFVISLLVSHHHSS